MMYQSLPFTFLVTGQQDQLACHFTILVHQLFHLSIFRKKKGILLFNTELSNRTTWSEFPLVLMCFNWHLASGQPLGENADVLYKVLCHTLVKINAVINKQLFIKCNIIHSNYTHVCTPSCTQDTCM